MYPLVFGIIPVYYVAAFAGFAAAFIIGMLRRKQYGYKPTDLIAMLCVSIMGLTIGAKLLFIITEIPAVVNNNFSWEIIKSRVINGGLVFYGGLIGALLCIYWLAKYMKLDARKMLSFVSPCFSAFHALGRIGCLLEGCCYGVESGHGLQFPQYMTDGSIRYITRVPVQLLEALVLVVITVLLLLFEYNNFKHDKKHELLPIYISMYAPARFILEFWRGDILRGVFTFTVNYRTTDGSFAFDYNLSTSQIISLILIVIVGLYWLRKLLVLRRRKKSLLSESEKPEKVTSVNESRTENSPEAEPASNNNNSKDL